MLSCGTQTFTRNSLQVPNQYTMYADLTYCNSVLDNCNYVDCSVFLTEYSSTLLPNTSRQKKDQPQASVHLRRKGHVFLHNSE